MKFRLFCLIYHGIFLFLASLGHAQTSLPDKPPSNILNKLEGDWYSKGNSFGSPTDVIMKWEPSLNDKFVHLSYKLVMHPAGKKDDVFEGTAYYKADSLNKYSATWFDSGGEMHPITATDDGTTLSSIWGVPGKKIGKTTYTFIDSNTVEIVDYIQRKDQTWKEFNRNTLTRVN